MYTARLHALAYIEHRKLLRKRTH